MWDRLAAADQETPVLATYTITAVDLDQPFLGSVPSDYAEMAKLERMTWATPTEMFGERFHMDVDLLRALNPNADFGRVGTEISVAQPGPARETPVVRLVADKTPASCAATTQTAGSCAYPATIGSAANPSPSGEHLVKAMVKEAAYYYDRSNFQQGDNPEPLTIPPGPNNPVGGIWIDLDRPDLRHPRHARADQDQQDRVAWLRPADELGCARTGGPRRRRRPGRVQVAPPNQPGFARSSLPASGRGF